MAAAILCALQQAPGVDRAAYALDARSSRSRARLLELGDCLKTRACRICDGAAESCNRLRQAVCLIEVLAFARVAVRPLCAREAIKSRQFAPSEHGFNTPKKGP